MTERIYTIPVNEIFEEKDGCPICRLRDTLEERSIDYILGPAMMESDVRLETNKLGFCKEHLFMLAKRHSRLQLALILDTHLDEVLKNIKNKKLRPDKKQIKSGNVDNCSCYLCEKIEREEKRMYSTIAKLYSEDKKFRDSFSTQPQVCLKHYKELHAYSAPLVISKWKKEFENDVDKLAYDYLLELKNDVNYFTKMFDYRNSGEKADFKNSKDSIERSIKFLTSRMPE